MKSSRMVLIDRRVVTYTRTPVNLYDFLVANVCEVYVSTETGTIEIRMPTRTDNYSHFVAYIPLSVVENLLDVRDQIEQNDHNAIILRYIDDIVWCGDPDVVTNTR